MGEDRLKFSNDAKLRRQMRKRRWTEEQIREALQTPGMACMGKDGPATRYVHPVTGKSVIIDNRTGEIFHVGAEGYRYD
jgi:hypothetical protein